MHSLDVVHGDLKAVCLRARRHFPALTDTEVQANIMINAEGVASLTDFGLATVLHRAGTLNAKKAIGGTLRWMSPELLVDNEASEDAGKPTQASDIYALAMVFWEVRLL